MPPGLQQVGRISLIQPEESSMLEEPNTQEPAPDYQDQPDRSLAFVPGCRVCGRQDETLRLVRYPFVVSLLFVTYRRAFSGLWCRRHARLRHFLAALITTVVGWVGIPFGFIFTPLALWQLAKGGEQPPAENASLLRGLANYWQGKGDQETAWRCLEASLLYEANPGAYEKLRRLYTANAFLTPRTSGAILHLRFFGILLVLLAGAAAGGLTGLLNWLVSTLASPLYAQDATMIATILSWIPLVAIGVLSILGLVQLLGWVLQKEGVRSGALGAGLALVTSLMVMYGFLQGRAIGYFIDTVRYGVFLQTDEPWLSTGLAVLLRGGAAELLHIWGDKETSGMIYLILLICMAFFALLALKQAASQITSWQSRLAELKPPDSEAAQGAGFACWIALIIVPLGIALTAWLLPQRGVADFLQAMYAADDGLTWLDQGNPARAITALQQAVALRPGDAFFHDQLGWAFLEGKQPQNALGEFQTAQGIKASDYLAQAGLGYAYIGLNQFDQAAQVFEQFVKSHPDEIVGFLQLGYARLANAQIEAALVAFKHAASLNPQENMALEGLGQAYLVEGDARQAEQEFRDALGIDFESYDARVGLAKAFFAQFQYDAAIAQAEVALKNDPDASAARYLLAFGHYARGEFDQAVEQLKAVLEKEPDSQAAHAYLATLYYELDQPDQMRQSAKNAEDAADKDGSGWYMQGRYSYLLRDFPAAESALRKAVELQLFDSRNYLLLANALAYQGKYAQAQQACEQALVLAPSSADGYLCRSEVLVEQGELGQAIIELDAAQELDPGDLRIASDRSNIYLMQGRSQEALETARQTLQAFPYDAQVYVVAALAEYEQDPSEAQAFAQQAVKLAPKDDLAHYALGIASLSMGQLEQAASELRLFLSLYWERAGLAAYKAQAEAALQTLQ
jgi:tetratricopeptide (TPR) repeat protein